MRTRGRPSIQTGQPWGTRPIAAWQDEAHVQENRRLYKEKFERIAPILTPHLQTQIPDAGFYFWASVSKYAPLSDSEFTRRLYHQYNVSVLPGSYLAREANGINPGSNYIRIALVAGMEECVEAAQRIADFCKTL